MEKVIQNCLSEINALISNSNGLQNIDSELKEYELLKHNLQDIYENKEKGAIFPSKVRMSEEGEKPTRCFFNIVKEEL